MAIQKINAKQRPLFEYRQSAKGDWWAPSGFVTGALGDALRGLGVEMDDGSDTVLEAAQRIADKAVTKGMIGKPSSLGNQYTLTAVRNRRFGGKIGFVWSTGAGMGGTSSLGISLDD